MGQKLKLHQNKKIMQLKELLNSKSYNIKNQKIFKIENLPKDKLYKKFINESNGGYFFNNSLLFFGNTAEKNQNNIDYMNEIIEKKYGNIAKDLFFFGMDIFGNLFAFDKNNNVIFFNVETGDKEIIASNFKDWLKELFNDLEYYTGKDFISFLSEKQKKELIKGKRLSPKYPFVLGGDYNKENLVLKDINEIINFNADIAKQVYNLPDGSKIKIKIK